MKSYKQIESQLTTCVGTTPTYTFILPENVDLTVAEYLYVTFSTLLTDEEIFTKMEGATDNEDIHIIKPNVVSVDLTQEETFKFPLEGVMMQLNWVYHHLDKVKRGASEPVRIEVDKNLYDKVIE